MAALEAADHPDMNGSNAELGYDSVMRDLTRLVDANTNRASEAARTLEDVARFILDDGALAARAKHARHAIERVFSTAGFPRTSRSASRDTPGDHGTQNSQSDTHSREGLPQIVAAAGSRLAEALRVLEEAMKTIDPKYAAELERLRYDAYETERLVARRLRVAAPDWRVCVLLTKALCTNRNWREVLHGTVRGGAQCIQIREKDLADRELIQHAREVIDIARPAGVAVVLNDRPDIARIVGADGLHLGQGDVPLSDARQIVGDSMNIGVSCSNLSEAIAASEAGADVLGIGAMYSTDTKLKPSIAGPTLLTDVLEHESTRDVPHLAIGGIDAGRACSLAALGCRGVAVSSSVCSALDPETVTAEIAKALADSNTLVGAKP